MCRRHWSPSPAGGYYPIDCPCCDWATSDTRDRLEALMRNGGRRAHRLRIAVAELDQRFLNATTEYPAWRSLPWWHRREPTA